MSFLKLKFLSLVSFFFLSLTSTIACDWIVIDQIKEVAELSEFAKKHNSLATVTSVIFMESSGNLFDLPDRATCGKKFQAKFLIKHSASSNYHCEAVFQVTKEEIYGEHGLAKFNYTVTGVDEESPGCKTGQL